MKKIFVTSWLLTLSIVFVFAQAPNLINYQGVARDNGGLILENQQISLEMTVWAGFPNGINDYTETHTVSTNQFGLFNVQIGGGLYVSGDFTSIDWGSNTYHLQVKMDAVGGSNYVDMGTSQLVSVPYALYAESSGSSTPGPIGPTGATGPTGTFQNGTSVGEMNYWDGSAWVAIPSGTYGQTLTFCDGFPSWSPCPPPQPTPGEFYNLNL